MIRIAAALALAALWAAALPPPAPAETLVVPLTGKRVRDIQTQQLFHTLLHDFFLEDDATTYVQTGDIPAMWLRDSSAQTIPYIRYQKIYPVLRARFAGVIERNARNILTDPYANALQADYHVWERKWEVDSLAWPAVLASVYWRSTGDATIFTPNLHAALRTIVSTYECEAEHGQCSRYRYPYRTGTHDAYNPGTGMIWGAFRPSDDPVQYRFNIPQNALAVVALRDIDELAMDGYGDAALGARALELGTRVYAGVQQYGRYFDRRRRAWMYGYETDGYGRYAVMDDANIPNLTTLPYIDWCSSHDPIYLATRNLVLSPANPYYYTGRYAQGLGSPHTPPGYVWPIGHGRARADRYLFDRGSEAITTLAETDSEGGLDARELLCRRILALHAHGVWMGQRVRRGASLPELGRRAGDAVRMARSDLPLRNAARRRRGSSALHADRERRRKSSQRSGACCTRRGCDRPASARCGGRPDRSQRSPWIKGTTAIRR